MIKYLNRFSFWLLAAAMISLTACNDDDDDDTPDPDPSPETIVDIAAESPQFSILVDALIETGLADDLETDGPFTVFAPNNDAFNQLFDDLNLTDDNSSGDRLDELVDELGVDAVSSILLYHVLDAEVRAEDVTDQTYVSTLSIQSPSANRLSLLAEPAGSTVEINGGDATGATVMVANVDADNGVIHEINAVLLLPSVVDHATYNSNLSSLTSAVLTADLFDALNDSNSELTVFAPLNSAFSDIQETVDGLTEAQLAEVLQYHVVGTQVRSGDISPGPVNSLTGEAFTIGVDGNTVTITDAQGGTSTVVITDIQGTNGVVHVIDAVLIPTL